MRPYDILIERLTKGETVYLLNEFYSTAIKCLPETTRFKAKHKGGPEYTIDTNTDLVREAIADVVEITKEQYDSC